MRVSTLIIVVAVALAIGYFVWQLWNSKLAGRARRNQQRRTSDRAKLNKSDKTAYRQAQKLYQEGNFRGSAKILESMGMLREAITILEKSGLVREAADALIRIQRPNRAGSLLARNGMWKEAMECFKKANLPLEVGRCARELGDLPTAIPYFLEAKAHIEAAECYLELGKHHEAARIFFRIKEVDRALEQYVYFVDNDQDIERASFSDEELAFIQKKLVEGRVDSRLADILVAKNRLVPLIIDLIRTGNNKSATAAFMRSTTDIGPELIAHSDFKREENLLLGALFANVGSYEYSGMVYERMEEFERAGDSFEKGELFDRAAYCFERAGNKARATEMRIQTAAHGPSNSKPLRQVAPAGGGDKAAPSPSPAPTPMAVKSSNPFSIQDTTTDALKPPTSTHPLPRTGVEERNPASVPPASMAHLGADAPKPKPVMPEPDPKVDWEPFFRAEFLVDLSSSEQKLLQQIAKIRNFTSDSVILDYNHAPAGIYFVVKGHVSVHKAKNGEEGIVDDLQPSDTFGELWLLNDQPTKVKFVAKSGCVLAIINRAEFEKLMDENGAIARKLYRRFALKLFSKLVNEQNRLKKKLAS